MARRWTQEPPPEFPREVGGLLPFRQRWFSFMGSLVENVRRLFGWSVAAEATIDDHETRIDTLEAGGALDPELAAIAVLTSAADKVPYFTGSETAALADFTSAARTLCSAANVAAQQDALDLLPGTDVPDYDTPLVHHSLLFSSSAATAAGARTTGINVSTAIAARQKTPAGKTFKVLGVTASVESGAAVGTYTIKAVIYNHTDATETTLATFAAIAASTVDQVEATGTVSSPLATIPASKTFSIGWANDASSPGALSTNNRAIIVTGFYL